jgi:3-dehydroquinate dehydratase-2
MTESLNRRQAECSAELVRALPRREGGKDREAGLINEELEKMKKIQIINGPNLNLLGVREPSVYGDSSFDSYLQSLKALYPQCEVEYYQSNVEGELINKIHETGFSFDGIILNAGAYTHTSVALHDAIKAVTTPVVEVHISNVYTREPFRHKSLLAAVCKGVIAGFGLDSYRLAMEAVIKW